MCSNSLDFAAINRDIVTSVDAIRHISHRGNRAIIDNDIRCINAGISISLDDTTVNRNTASNRVDTTTTTKTTAASVSIEDTAVNRDTAITRDTPGSSTNNDDTTVQNKFLTHANGASTKRLYFNPPHIFARALGINGEVLERQCKITDGQLGTISKNQMDIYKIVYIVEPFVFHFILNNIPAAFREDTVVSGFVARQQHIILNGLLIAILVNVFDIPLGINGRICGELFCPVKRVIALLIGPPTEELITYASWITRLYGNFATCNQLRFNDNIFVASVKGEGARLFNE